VRAGSPRTFRSPRLCTSPRVEFLHKAKTPLKGRLGLLSLPAFWNLYLGRYFGSSQLRSISLLGLVGVVIYQGESKQSLLPELEKELSEKIMALLKLLGEDVSVVREGYGECLYKYFLGEEFVSRCLDIFDLDMDTAMIESKGLRRKEQNEVLSLLTRAKSVEDVKKILSNVKDPALFLCLENSCESCLSKKKSPQKTEIVADITEIFRLQVQKLEGLCDEIKTVWDLDHVSVHSKGKDEGFLISLMQKSILYCLFLKKPPESLYLFCGSHQSEFWNITIQHLNDLKKKYPLNPVLSVFFEILTYNLHLSLRIERLERTLLERTAIAGGCLRETRVFLERKIRQYSTEKRKGTSRFEVDLVEFSQKTEGAQRTISDVSQGDAHPVKGDCQRKYFELVSKKQRDHIVFCCEEIFEHYQLWHVGQLLKILERLDVESRKRE